MSVVRIKAYHGTQNAISNPIDYIANDEKTDMSKHQEWFDQDSGIAPSGSGIQMDANAENAFDYAANPEKTTYQGDMGTVQELVSGYMCDPDMAVEQFQATMDLYYQNHDEHLTTHTARRIFRAKLDEDGQPVLDTNGNMIYDEKAPVWHDADGKCRYETYEKEMQARTAYMWVLSFPPESVCGYKIDPRICHQIGLEFIKQVGGGQYQAVISTHMDKAHPHDHIVMSAYAKDGSHKYHDNLDSLMYARQVCDDLSRKFGLPVLPSLSQEQGKAIDWAEWKSKQEGQSWKEQMKQDIRGAVRIARSYDQFIEIMKDSGYGIRETERHITYIMPGEDEYRCRDKRLGSEFEKTAIMEHFAGLKESKDLAKNMADEAVKQNIDDPSVKKSHNPIHIFVSRYTLSGRRRSDLEMIFLVAIKIIRALKDRFRDMTASKAQPMNPIHRDWAWKERQMIDSLKMCQELDIHTKVELEDLVKEIGTKLSIARKEVKDLELDAEYSEKVLSLLNDIESYREQLLGSGFNESSLFLNALDDTQVRLNKARENPATPSQRRELYIQLQKYNNIYKLTCKYDELNAREAAEVISYLQGKSSKKPAVLVEGRDKEDKELFDKYSYILKKRLAGEKEKYQEPATDAQKNKVTEILEGRALDADKERLRMFENMEMDTDTLTKYDAMQLIHFFTAKTSLTAPLADVMSRDKIVMMLEADADKSLALSRPVETLTLEDVKEVESYLKLLPDRRKYVQKPNVLKPYEAPASSYVQQAQDLLRIRGIEITVPLDALSKSEIYSLTDYLLKKDAIPDCLQSDVDTAQNRNDTLFEQHLLDYEPHIQKIIMQLRDAEQQLMDLGIKPEDYDKEKKIVRGDIDKLEGRLQDIEALKREYKNLQRLKYNYGLATSEVFTRGGKFGKQDEKLEIEEQTESTRRSDEEKRQDEDIERQEQKKYKASDPRAFSFTDVYFDQTHPL
nr:relaxase/mobilization nuclease domain-containing protein [uncultured Butyrivibrio sp.]